jgi:WD40 repeat protein
MFIIPPSRSARRILACCVAAWVVLAADDTACGQATLVRLANDEPEVRFVADGRSGVCDVLTFTADGTTLLAVGEDKVVHRWAIAGNRLGEDKPIFWNTFREQRGSIYALALSTHDPNRPLIAIGGNGKLNSDVAIFDVHSGQLMGAVSPLLDAPGEYIGAGKVIWSLAFQPEGRELAIGDDGGNVWVCPLVQGKPLTAKSRRLPPVRRESATQLDDLRVLWVGYLPKPDGRLAFACGDGVVYVAGEKGPTPLFNWGIGPVEKVVASGDGKRLAALPREVGSGTSRVKVRSLLPGGSEKAIEIPRTSYAERLALDTTGQRLAIALTHRIDPKTGTIRQKLFATELPGQVLVMDVSAPEPKPIASMAVSHRPDQLAFHPDGKRLATADAIKHGTSLWAIENGGLRELAYDGGNGFALWAVGMTRDGRFLSFKTARDPDPEHPNERADPKAPWVTFDLNGEVRGWAPAKPPVPPETSRGGWTVAFQGKGKPRNEYHWFVIRDGREFRLPLNELQDDRPRCYTFLPPGKGAKPGSVRLAVGHAWGLSVFELNPGEPPQRIRRMNGHAGYVTAIAPTHDGDGLVTCGRDGVIAIWNLADFPSQSLMGASFEQMNGKIVVKAVDLGSPAHEAGLSRGDEVLAFKRGDSTEAVPKEKWLDYFRNPIPNLEMLWFLNPVNRPPGDTRQYAAKSLLLHRPAARFLPMTNREWVLYTYRQCYYDCSANGDRYIQWLVSKDRADKQPDVFDVEQFKKFLHRPEKVSDVVTRLQRESAQPLLPDLFPPKVVVKADVVNPAANQDVKVTVTVTPQPRQDGKVNPVARVELWLNGHHRVGLDTLQGRKFAVGVPFDVVFTVKAEDLRSGANRLHAIGIGFDDPGTGSGLGKSNELLVSAPIRAVQPRLFVVVAGIADYSSLLDGDKEMDLPGARRDARRMTEFWAGVRAQGGYVADAVSTPRSFIDADVSKERLKQEILAVARQARPEDRFVLFLSGHGAQYTAAMKEPTKGEPSDWYYIIPQLDSNKPLTGKDIGDKEKLRRAWLRDSELAELLVVELKCQPLVFLDCCHSGAAGAKVGQRALQARNAVRGFTPNGYGPVVVAACAENQRSWEDIVAFGGGVFTTNVIRTIENHLKTRTTTAAPLTATEFYRLVAAGTEADAAKLTDPKTGLRVQQRPEITPRPEDLAGLVIISPPKSQPGK